MTEKKKKRESTKANRKFNKCVRGLTIACFVFAKRQRNGRRAHKMTPLYMMQTWGRTHLKSTLKFHTN